MNTNARRVKAGYTYDPECSRASYRLSAARQLLEAAGVVGVTTPHDESCILHPNNRFNRCHGYSYSCDPGCSYSERPVWPEWVTDEMFEHAYALADAVQTESGKFARSSISR